MSRKSMITSFSVCICVFITLGFLLSAFILKSFLEFLIQLLNTVYEFFKCYTFTLHILTRSIHNAAFGCKQKKLIHELSRILTNFTN